MDPRRPLLFWGGRVGQSTREGPIQGLGHVTTRLHIGLLYPRWREDLLRDEYQELTCKLPLETDLTPALLRLLVQNGWRVPTARLEVCFQSGRQPKADLTIRQMLLLQPELMGEWRASFHFLEMTPDRGALLKTCKQIEQYQMIPKQT